MENAASSFLYSIDGKRKYVTALERTAFLDAAENRPAHIRMFCRVLAYTGARISEILALTPRQIDFTAGVIVVESLKKRRRGIYRALPVPIELLAELERVHSIRSAQIDPVRSVERIWKFCRTTAWKQVKACMAEGGIAGEQAMPKGLRHGFGVGVLQSGVPINLAKKWLGHSRLTTTEIYTDAVGAEEQAIAKRFWRTFSK